MNDSQEQKRESREKRRLDLIEERIQEAMERGEFDNLPGKGRPLCLERNPFAGDWELAYHVMKNAGYAPEWIERDREVRQELADLRAMLANHLAWHREAMTELARARDPLARRAEIARAREQVIARYRERAAALNKKIDVLNLMVPTPRLQRPRVRIEEEIRRFERELDGPR
jgi:DnaJ family protein C protein 28